MGFLLLFAGGAAAAIALSAIQCAKGGRYLGYLGYVAALTLAAILLSFATVPLSYPTLKEVIGVVLSFLPLSATYAVVPGLLVRRMASPKAIIAATLLATVIAVPCWLVFGLYVSCRMGLGCI